MTDVKEDLERKAFEEWYCSKTSESIGMKRYPNGRFRNPETENMYLAWRAAKSHATQSAWISVEERLPKYDEKGYIQIVYIDDEGDRVSGDGAYIPNFGFLVVKPEVRSGELDWIEYETDTVTHWKYYDSLPPINA